MKSSIFNFHNSLKYRLLSLLLLSLTLLIGTTAYFTYKSSLEEMEEILDGHMVINSRALFSIVVVELRETHIEEIPVILENYVRFNAGEIEKHPSFSRYEPYISGFYMQLVDRFGKTVFSSNGVALVEDNHERDGMFEVSLNDKTWHAFGQIDSVSGYKFYTAHSEDVRNELSREALQHMLLPFVIGTLLILVAVWYAIHLGLKPLHLLGAELDARDVSSLKPIQQSSHTLIELQSAVNALNRLFERMKSMLDNEQRFSADVSHELRTSLARIMANTDALKTMTKDSAQLKFIDNIDVSTTSAKELSEDLLLLSKLGVDNAKDYFECERFNALKVVEREIKHLEEESSNSNDSFQLNVIGKPQFMLQGSATLFSILIKNLLDNARKYGNSEKPANITLAYDKSLSIVVRDFGPGVSQDSLDKLFERFYRANNSNSVSTGLGLAIVKSIATHFDATLTPANAEPTGLSIAVKFPPSAEH